MSNNNKEQQQSSAVKIGSFGRRQWDEQVYKAKAMERLAREENGQVEEKKRKVAIPKEKQPLQAREDGVHLDDIVGRRGVVTAETAVKSSIRHSGTKGIVVDPNGGFYCKTCECVIKDSISYLDHMNSKGHLAASGMSNRAVRATVDDVRRTLSQPPPHKKSKALKKDQTLMEERILQEQTEIRKKESQLKRVLDGEPEVNNIYTYDNDEPSNDDAPVEPAPVEEKKPVESENLKPEPQKKQELSDAELMAKMGFGGFSSSKKK